MKEGWPKQNKRTDGIEHRQHERALRALEGEPLIETPHKVGLFGVAIGLKPSTVFSVLTTPRHRKRDLQRIDGIIRKLNLVASQEEVSARNPANVHVEFKVAKELDVLAELDAALGERAISGKEGLSDSYHVRMGKILGFPETAVNAWIRNDDMPPDQRRKLLSDEELAFSSFVPSKEHFKEELASLNPLISAIKAQAPGLYSKAIAVAAWQKAYLDDEAVPLPNSPRTRPR